MHAHRHMLMQPRMYIKASTVTGGGEGRGYTKVCPLCLPDPKALAATSYYTRALPYFSKQ